MILLGIDTAHPHDQMIALLHNVSRRPSGRVSLALARPHSLRSCVWHGKWDESETVLLKITELLKKNHLAFRDLSGIIVHRGPGSFSSVRIGVTIANSLAYALGIPIYGISTPLIDFCRKFPKSMKDQSIVTPLYTHAAHISKSTGLWYKISSKH